MILGVDRILDMSRTVVNVSGDLAVATCVAAGETSAGEISAGDSRVQISPNDGSGN